MGETSWAFLLIGSVAAAGAALAVGTLAALLRYRRAGALPGADAGRDGGGTLPRGQLVALWVRVGIGVAVAVLGVVVLRRTGIL